MPKSDYTYLLRRLDEMTYHDRPDAEKLLNYCEDVRRFVNWVHFKDPQAAGNLHGTYSELDMSETKLRSRLRSSKSFRTSAIAADFSEFRRDFRETLNDYMRYADDHGLWDPE